MSTLRVTKSLVGLVYCVALVACESGSAAPPTGPSVNPNAGIGLSVSRTVVATPRTWNAIVDVDVVRTGSFSGTVDLSIAGLPPGVTSSFSTATLSPNATGSRLNIEVENTAAYGTYPLTVRASGAGVSSSTATVSLVVPRPSFSITVDPSIFYFTSKDFFTGDTLRYAQAVGEIARDSAFRGPVEFSVLELPTGFISAPPTVPANQDSWGVVVGAKHTVVAGTYSFTIQATAVDAAPRTVTFNIVVPPR